MGRKALGTCIGLALALAGPAVAVAGDTPAGGASAPSGKVASDSGGGVTYSTQLIADREAAARRKAARRKAQLRRAALKRQALRRKAARERRRLIAAKRRARARARARRIARREAAPRSPATAPAPASGYVFPLLGPYSYGGKGGRFGAKRDGHVHQGQDLAAAAGTPVVAPYGGTVRAVRFQARGAGHYVVLAGSDGRGYVFMHLRKGSTLVTARQAVVAGQQLAEVGSTGRSFGAHLHLEVWVGGGWYTGGEPVDPLPLLRSWPGGS